MSLVNTTQFSMLSRSQLEKGSWYIGRGRNVNVGLWDGETFLVIAQLGRLTGKSGKEKWRTETGIKYEPYFDDSQGVHHQDEDGNDVHCLGTFQPFLKISEGLVTEDFGTDNSDTSYGYGKLVEFQNIETWNNIQG